MGGAKTASPNFTQPDPNRDLAVLMAADQLMSQQQAQQATLLQAQAQMPPEQQFYDTLATSRRAGELGMANLQKSRELEQMTNPEAAAMRQAQGAEAEKLTSPEVSDQYMKEWMARQGLANRYATGIEGTAADAATYDAALQARRAFEQQQIAQKQAILQQNQAPVGGIDPSTSIAAQQAAQAQNIANLQNFQNQMYGNAGGYSQSVADQQGKLMSDFRNLAQVNQQNRQNYENAMLNAQMQNAAEQNAKTQAMYGAIGIAAGQIGGAMAMQGGGGGLNSSGFYGSESAASKGFNVPVSDLSYQKSTGLGGFMGFGKSGGYYYNPGGSYRT